MVERENWKYESHYRSQNCFIALGFLESELQS